MYFFLKSAPVFALRNYLFYLFVLSRLTGDVRSLVDVNKIFLLFIVNVAIIVSVPMFFVCKMRIIVSLQRPVKCDDVFNFL